MCFENTFNCLLKKMIKNTWLVKKQFIIYVTGILWHWKLIVYKFPQKYWARFELERKKNLHHWSRNTVYRLSNYYCSLKKFKEISALLNLLEFWQEEKYIVITNRQWRKYWVRGNMQTEKIRSIFRPWTHLIECVSIFGYET